ncbi:hypothetical protein BGW36DRAFT_417577 [Talaromyces proteolyticus]|uniref:Uncharacterized protein n=1 Tax=Talaromyces proteolyticus TaxID=1131652 RepID=A0AAD4PXI2_9EURO|nr:uncharacterized protein BGW36DRAFT_417577 [Talaromyces proteolyticus]KAH8696409.1 hypothetical protein BGW36DRAFT_417577 [Talaromyces proteolyticus]
MPSSKTDTAIRYPEAENQKRRLRHVTQDRRWESRMRDQAVSNPQFASDATSWGPETLLDLKTDENGNPQPDPAQFRDGNKAIKKGLGSSEQDMTAAANYVP